MRTRIYGRRPDVGDEKKCDEVTCRPDEIIEYAEMFGTLEHREIEFTEKALPGRHQCHRELQHGRLFDGVAAMLGICDYNSYEGQCAMLLEDAAARAIEDPARRRSRYAGSGHSICRSWIS